MFDFWRETDDCDFKNLRNLVQEKVPDLNVHTELYPKYDTRGDLAVCVEAFKEWLQGKITDLETKAENKNAIRDPSVEIGRAHV